MTAIKTHKCISCNGEIVSRDRCWNPQCILAGIAQAPPREARAEQTPKQAQSQSQQLHKSDSHTQTLESSALTPDLCEDEGCPQHGTPHVCVSSMSPESQVWIANKAEELKLLIVSRYVGYEAKLGLDFNREPTDHERASLEVMIRLFLKGYADAR